MQNCFLEAHVGKRFRKTKTALIADNVAIINEDLIMLTKIVLLTSQSLFSWGQKLTQNFYLFERGVVMSLNFYQQTSQPSASIASCAIPISVLKSSSRDVIRHDMQSEYAVSDCGHHSFLISKGMRAFVYCSVGWLENDSVSAWFFWY